MKRQITLEFESVGNLHESFFASCMKDILEKVFSDPTPEQIGFSLSVDSVKIIGENGEVLAEVK